MRINEVLYIQNESLLELHRADVTGTLNQEFEFPVRFASPTSLTDAVVGADVVVTPTLPDLDKILTRLPNLRWVHFLSSGVDRIWSMDFDWSKIILTKSSGVHSVPMSEFAIGAMLYFAKHFDQFSHNSQKRVWNRTWLDELFGKKVLVLGAGRVGNAVLSKAQAFGMEGAAIGTRVRDHSNFKVFGWSDLPDLLPTSDYVVIALPLTPETSGKISVDFLCMMKDGAVIVDVSRGGILDADALCHALDSGKLRGAALDVFETEPLPVTSKLWGRQNVLITPHVSGTTPRYLGRALDIFIENVNLYQRDESMVNRIDLQSRY